MAPDRRPAGHSRGVQPESAAAHLPEPGQSLADFGSSEPAPFLSVDPVAGTLAVRPEMLGEVFMHDCPDQLPDALLHLVPQSASIAAHPVRAAAWKQVPSTYVVCAEDRGTPAARQREFAERATDVVELATGHHPFLARPQEVADLVLARA